MQVEEPELGKEDLRSAYRGSNERCERDTACEHAEPTSEIGSLEERKARGADRCEHPAMITTKNGDVGMCVPLPIVRRPEKTERRKNPLRFPKSSQSTASQYKCPQKLRSCERRRTMMIANMTRVAFVVHDDQTKIYRHMEYTQHLRKGK